jgi:hypothetical protein
MILGALSDALAALLSDFLRNPDHDQSYWEPRLFA